MDDRVDPPSKRVKKEEKRKLSRPEEVWKVIEWMIRIHKVKKPVPIHVIADPVTVMESDDKLIWTCVSNHDLKSVREILKINPFNVNELVAL